MKQNSVFPGKRMISLDILKILAAFMVCFYHLNMLDMGYSPGNLYLPNANRMLMNLCAMSVPLFFMVNGALLLRRPHSVSEILARFVRLCFLYVFWSIVTHGILSLACEGRFVLNMHVFMMRDTPYTVHLWFLKTAAILTLLTPVLYFLCTRKSRLPLYVLLLILLIFPFLYNYALLAGRLLNIPACFYLRRTGAGTMYSIVYFILGKLLADHVRSKKAASGRSHFRTTLQNDAILCPQHVISRNFIINKITARSVQSALLSWVFILYGWILVTLEGTLWTNIHHAVFDSVNGSFPTIGALLMAVGTFLLVSSAQLPRSQMMHRLIAFAGSHIIGTYLLHPIFTHVIRYTLNTYISAPISMSLTALIMLVSLLITAALRRIPLIRRLLSM